MYKEKLSLHLYICIPVSLRCRSYEMNYWNNNPADIYQLKVNNRNTRTRCGICSKLTINIPEQRHRPSVSIVNFEHVIAGWAPIGKSTGFVDSVF